MIFGGKAAPGYRMAKLIIRLIHGVADVINRDPRVSQQLKVVFFPDFNVKNGQHIYPAAELSEQISTAGKEASGTGNMKFAMNGALTIGTLDGANIEIREAVGADNFFLFGLTAAEVATAKAAGYSPRPIYESNPELHEAIDLIDAGVFSNGDRQLFRPLVESLLVHDDYLLFADYQPYMDCQQRVGEAYGDQQNWTRMSILNCARVGRFSSDRSIRELPRHLEREAGGPGRTGDEDLESEPGCQRAARRHGNGGRRELQRVLEERHGHRAAALRRCAGGGAVTRRRARRAPAPDVSLLARVRARPAAGPGLRLPCPRAASRPNAACGSTRKAALGPLRTRSRRAGLGYDRGAAIRPATTAPRR